MHTWFHTQPWLERIVKMGRYRRRLETAGVGVGQRSSSSTGFFVSCSCSSVEVRAVSIGSTATGASWGSSCGARPLPLSRALWRFCSREISKHPSSSSSSSFTFLDGGEEGQDDWVAVAVESWGIAGVWG